MMKAAATQEEANAATLVFWDIKKFPVPHGFDARRVRPCIKRWLEDHGYHGPLTINAVGILTDVHRDILGALSSSGINLYYAPYGPSDIMDLMCQSTYTKPSPANLLGICDPIFLHKSGSGFNIFGPFSSSPSSPYEISWINLILEVSEALDEDTCSETYESGGWCCLVCSEHIRYIRRGSFESFTSHLSSRDHERRKFRFLPVEDYQTMDLFEDEDVNPPTIVRKQPEEATPDEAFAVTAVFWDMNMFPIPSYFDASRVRQCIKRFLEKYGYKGPLFIQAFGILTNFAPDNLEALSSSGIILIPAAHGSTAIKREMSRWIYQYPSPVVNLMGICDPRGFPLPLTGFPLPLTGYNIFRPFPYSSPQLDGQLWKSTLLAGVQGRRICAVKQLDLPAGLCTRTVERTQPKWAETFESWLREAEWSKKGHTAPMEEYIRNGMISIAAHTIALSMSCLMEPCFPQNKLKPGNYDNITTLLMIIPRLLNDLQSYQKEQEQGKINSVLLHLKNHPGLKLEDSIAHIEKIIDSKRKEFLEHVLVDGLSDLPKPCKEIHLSCCKVFEMFFNKKNRFDSETEMLQDIKKALYDPLNVYEVSEIETMPLMTHGDEFMILPLLLKSSPKILEIKSKDEYGAMRTSMCLRRSYHVHKRIMVSQLDNQRKPLKIVASQRISVPMMRTIFSPCFY